jgi:predicted RNA-binding Zn-ribbon protein involved in translation (DUF1610 family)
MAAPDPTVIPPGAKAVPAPCPNCQQPTLHIEEKLKARPLGSFSLAGAQMKFSARAGVFLVCRSCGAEAEGVVEDGSTHATFDPADMVTIDPDAKEATPIG